TYCPLCGSGVTAVREVDGEETVFGVSGLLWKSDLVMYDKRTGSLWSQILATAINGPKTGETLDLLPSTLTTWGEWRKTHPDSKVLLPPPISGTVVGEAPRHYEINPYEGYDDSRRIGIGSDEFEDDRLHPKRLVLGIRASGVAKAYPLNKVKEEKVINDKVGNLPVVVAVGPDNTLVSYVRRLNGKEFRFKPDGNRHMRGGGSRWLINTGRAVDGPHEGETLKKANEMTPMFWFAWLDFNPETTVYGNE
ncbi:MAG: DUF3179 domain-containing (seleno)protein, partial [Halobacteria archaeon]|nr:DUF3179 domain-containing (seleno)protein [Halobacteria archaeon]